MSYQQPQDYYTHSNASQFDDRYQQGAYRDDSTQNSSQAYPPNQRSRTQAYDEPSSRCDDVNGPNAATIAATKYSYAPAKKPVSKWVKIGIPVFILLLIVAAGAALGGYFGTRSSASSSTSASKAGSSSNTNAIANLNSWTGLNTQYPSSVNSSVLTAASKASKAGGGNDLLYTATDIYGNPIWSNLADDLDAPSMGGATEVGNCGSDPWTGTNSTDDLRPHPRIMAAQYEWDCLPQKIANDAYLTLWNATIFSNATVWASMSPVNYSIDGGLTGSGVLDPAREVQQRIKAWGYAYRISKDTKWVDRMWTELQTAAGNTSQPWGQGDTEGTQAPHWNSAHFLDLAELTASYAIAYDWLYDVWSDDQKTAIMWSIISLGLQEGLTAYNSGSGWFFTTASGSGNWNCVCNSGLMLGALAIKGDDPTGISDTILQKSIDNISQNCMRGVYPDGTWTETPNYWYFGTNAHARAISALTTSTGSDQGIMAMNPNFTKTGLFHMYVSGMGGMFAYADNGPNKFGSTANSMMLYSKLEQNPLYSLFQRDRADASFDPLSMLWYDTTTKGAYWKDLALDNYFDTVNGSWVSMRSSWTDFTGTFVGMKASVLTGHQTHGDLDVGDFVIDAMGVRWAGEYGSGNYLSENYFSNETQGSERWEYYRKGTQGQNTLIIGNQNQRVTAYPQNSFGTTNAAQNASLSYKPGVNDAAYFITDMSSAYDEASGAVKRGIRMLNGRRQVLLQDEILSSVTDSIVWAVQTNASITLSSDAKTATLTQSSLVGINAGANAGAGHTSTGSLPKAQTMIVKILSPLNAKFEVVAPLANDKPNRLYGTDPNMVAGEDGDQVELGVNRLQITLDGGVDQTITVVWQPQWVDMSGADAADPKQIDLSAWSTTSHNA